MTIEQEPNSEPKPGDKANSSGQTVDAVDKVDGVDQRYENKYGKRNAPNVIYEVPAKNSVEVIYLESPHDHKGKGGDDLYDEFLGWVKRQDVVF